jgi:crotonobetainyl-CoA:carnitine CoA-transferase CaiB-like acyl-CoA transferase
MLEATVEWMGYALYTQMHTGTQPPRMGLSHSSIAPYDAFPTSDGEVLIGVQNDSGWRTLAAQVLDAPGACGRSAEVQALLPPITFADTEAPMGGVPALGEHTTELIVEAGLEAEEADELIARGFARQSEHRTVGVLQSSSARP